jgi:hypothetical protein
MNLLNRIHLNLFIPPLLYSLHNFNDFHSNRHGCLVLQFEIAHFLRHHVYLHYSRFTEACVVVLYALTK